MDIDIYQKRAMQTCTPSCDNHAYMLTGFVGEVRELFSKIAKAIRKERGEFEINTFVNDFTEQEIHDLKSEVGDCQWFIAGICSVFGWSLEEICRQNLDKLADRAERGVIIGDGDNR